MAFDFTTLITDRTSADAAAVKTLTEKIQNGTATTEEVAAYVSASMKGAYNAVDLNRVTEACEYLAARFAQYGYPVTIRRPKITQIIKIPSKLPEGYIELSYIQSTGTQYVDSGFVPNSNSRVVADVAFANVSASMHIFGARTAAASAAFTCSIYSATSGAFQSEYGTAVNRPVSVWNGRHSIDKNKNVFTLDGVITTQTEQSFSCAYPLYLFTTNNGGSTHSEMCSMKLYAVAVYDNDALVRDFVPCINPSGDVGLYDLVNAQFYGNAGTGTFLMGTPVVALPDGYTRLSCIESTGTQYVDTGFVPNQDTHIVMDATVLNVNDANTGGFFFGSGYPVQQNGIEAYIYSGGVFHGVYNAVQTTGTVQISANQRLSIDFNKNVCSAYADGSSVYSNTFTYAAFTSPVNLILFSLARSTAFRGVLKMYSCHVYDNGTRVRFFIPCINADGEVGLYDLVTGAFFGNSGTGSFIAGSVPRALPEGYTQVEHLESSGTQYVDTDVTVKSTSGFVVDFSLVTAPAIAGIIGGFTYAGYNNNFAAYEGYWITQYGNNQGYTFGTTDTARHSITQNVTSGEVSFDGETIQTGLTYYDNTDKTFHLFCYNGGASYPTFWIGSMKLYGCQIYDNGTLVRDYVPCINSDGTAGLLDMVNAVFYPNAGTGTFSVGETVEIPESSGGSTTIERDYWAVGDIPTVSDLDTYLKNVGNIRAVLPVMANTPAVPDDMDRLTTEEANNIEVILLDMEHLLNQMALSFVYSNEFYGGEV